MTQEQQKIIEYDPAPGQIFTILAFAGTGKTTTLIRYAKSRPDKTFLYVAFNKSVQLAANEKFTDNVICKTAHALAYAKVGYKYRETLAPKIRPSQIASEFELEDYKLASFFIDTFQNFLISDDNNIKKVHIPPDILKIYNYSEKEIPIFLNIVSSINESIKQKLLPATHDWYLKQYQLLKLKLNYDYILLDEAQDINPVIAKIVLSQQYTDEPPVIILIGDEHQQIYSFRGTTGVLSKMKADKTMYLTKSFRFGNNIATLSNMLLSSFKNEKKEVVGNNTIVKTNWNDKKYTTIARTNACIFDKAVNLINKRKIGFAGPIEGYRFFTIKDLALFKYGKGRIYDPFINSFESYYELKKYVTAVNDVEFIGMCSIVEKYGYETINPVKIITNWSVEYSKAEVVLTTAHKSKGLEWENVYLCDDFIPLIKKGKKGTFKTQEKLDEVNLLYVALTRTMCNLEIDIKNSLIDFIKSQKSLEEKTDEKNN